MTQEQERKPGPGALRDHAVGRPFPTSFDASRLPSARSVPALGVGPAPEGGTGRIGIALMGLGDFTLRTVLPELMHSERCALAALVSGNREKALQVAAAYGLPDNAVYDYDRFDAIAEDERVDAVYNVLPNGLHADWTVRAFAAGKHVLCEKPMANTAEECLRMIAARDEAGKALMIAYRAHFEPHNQRAIALIREGALGELRTIVSDHHRILDLSDSRDVWRADLGLAGGGALPDLGIYGLNAACYLTGHAPEEVFARISTDREDPRFSEVEDQTAIQLRFPGGVLCTLTTSYSAAGVNTAAAFGTEGSFFMQPATSYRGNTLTLRKGGKTEAIDAGDGAIQFPRQFDHFAAAILDGTELLTPAEMGLRDMRLIEAIYASAREGRPLSLNPDGTVRGP